LSLEATDDDIDPMPLDRKVEQLKRRLDDIERRLRASGLMRVADDLRRVSKAVGELARGDVDASQRSSP
jgi:hypothetical protein